MGVTAAKIGAMDGVDLLHAGSSRLEQSGDLVDFRLGLHRTGARDRLSLLLLHSRVSMKHRVTWDVGRFDEPNGRWFQQRRIEINEDQTRTLGAHVAWDRELVAPGWRVGASATLNYKDHPKIPNYVIQNIPRDPGTTWPSTGLGSRPWQEATSFSCRGRRSPSARPGW